MGTWPARIGAIVAVVALVVVAVRVDRAVTGRVVTEAETDTVTVEAERVVRDTVMQTVPRLVRVTDTVRVQDTDTVRAAVPVKDSIGGEPVPWRPHGLITSAPVDIDGHRVTLTYWQPDARRWVQNEYRVDRPAFGLTARVGSQVLPQTSVAYGRLEAQYRVSEWIHLTGNAGQAVTEDGHGWTGGVSIGLSLDQVWR